MNVGDLVRINPEWTAPKNNLGIIVQEYQSSHPAVDNLSYRNTPSGHLPELYYHVYNFQEKQILVYNSFEMKIINKAPRHTSYNAEEY